MRKTTFLAVLLPLFITSCSLFDKKKEVEEITEEVTSPSVWTSASELSGVESDFDEAFATYRENYSGGFQEDIRNAFKATMLTSVFDANLIITGKYHDWRVDNPFADGDAFITIPNDDLDYLYEFFADYPDYFIDWRQYYTTYGETVALDSLQADCVMRIDGIIDQTCQDFIENWRIGAE